MTAEKVRFVVASPRNDRGEVTYEVWRGDVLLGEVERYADPTYRSLGRGSRIRGGLMGYSRYWRPRIPRGEGVNPFRRNVVTSTRRNEKTGHYEPVCWLAGMTTIGEHTRAEAVDALLLWHDHPERRDTDV